jgi:cation transport ATPase
VLRAALLPIGAVLFLGAGAVPWLMPAERAVSAFVWMGGLLLTGTPLVWRTARGLVRGHFAAVLLGQPLAGLVIVLMQSGGEALERYAEGRASAAVRALVGLRRAR